MKLEAGSSAVGMGEMLAGTVGWPAGHSLGWHSLSGFTDPGLETGCKEPQVPLGAHPGSSWLLGLQRVVCEAASGCSGGAWAEGSRQEGLREQCGCRCSAEETGSELLCCCFPPHADCAQLLALLLATSQPREDQSAVPKPWFAVPSWLTPPQQWQQSVSYLQWVVSSCSICALYLPLP